MENLMSVTTFIKEKSPIIILFLIFIFSIILDIYVLTRYNLSYGLDGPFYDLKVLNILKTGFPASNDPPLVYYILTPFVAITGNSFLGIKIGMSIIGSLMVFPAYFLTEIFRKKIELETKVPALLSAFLITINISYFQMIGDFMQNLVGVLFLLLLIYFTVQWLENISKWRKYGTISIIMLLCSILTHIYTGLIAVIVFVSLFLFNLILTKYKTGKIPVFDLKILGLMSFLIVGGLSALFIIYPVMFSKFTTVLSFFNGTTNSNQGIENSINISIFLTIPFLLGLIAAIKFFYTGLKNTNISQKIVISNKTLLSWAYLILTSLLVILSLLPSDYQSRFIAIAFVPIALLTPLGVKLIENWISNKYPSKYRFKIGIISIIAVIFALSSFYTAAGTFSEMSPSISSDEYNSLIQIKTSYMTDKIDPNGIMVVDDYHTGYWVQYTLGMQVETGNLTELKEKFPDKKLYGITLTKNQSIPSKTVNQYLWNPFLPYSFPFGGINLFSNILPDGIFNENLTSNGRNNLSPDDINSTHNTIKGLPALSNGTIPSNARNQTSFNSDNVGGLNGDRKSLNAQNIFANGTLIFYGGHIKIYELL
jgi:hypothetical protein